MTVDPTCQRTATISPEEVAFLVSPLDRSQLSFFDETTLVDRSGNRFPIVNGIPRFVKMENYSSSFGVQWNVFRRTQIDKFNGTSISHDRLFSETGWQKSELRDQTVLEVGSGAGRFTQVLLDAGAVVYSIDSSTAVDANLANNGPHRRLHLYQASVYNLPFRNECFDKIVCLGVLQHTPDVRRAFLSMIPHLKLGGEIAVDVYALTWKTYLWSKYWYRPITKRIEKQKLLKIIDAIIPKWYPLSSLLLKIPRIGFYLSQIIPNANHSVIYPQLSKEQLLEWAILDTFDMLSPQYDKPQTLRTLRRYFLEAGLEILRCDRGGNGYVGIGRKPLSAAVH